MPIFMVEREFAEQVELTDEHVKMLGEYEPAHEIKWINSFLSADKKKSYCLYEAESIEVLQQHARDMGLPITVITPVESLTR